MSGGGLDQAGRKAPHGFDDVDEVQLRRRRTVKWTLYGPDVLAAWVAETDFAVAPPIRAALYDAIERNELGYPPAETSELTTSCAAYLAGSYGWKVPQMRIFLVADVWSGIAGALDTFVAPGSGVVLPTPAYPPLFDVIELSGRRVIEAPLQQGLTGPALDLDAIGKALSSGARAVLLCNPHNPTGRVFTTEELTALGIRRRRPRRPGHRRRGARAPRLPREPVRALRLGVRRGRRSRRHGYLRLQGLEHPGAEVRPGRGVQSR